MSKSKRFGSHKKPLRVEVQKHESNTCLKGLSDYKRAKCRNLQPSFMRSGYIPKNCSALLTPGSCIANIEYRKNVEPMVFPKTHDHFQVEQNETSRKAAEEVENSRGIQPGPPSSLKKGLVSRKFTTPLKTRCRSASARIRKINQEPKIPAQAVEKSEKAAVPKPNLKSMYRRIGSIKCTSALVPSSRIIGGGSEGPAPLLEYPRYQCPVKPTPCKAPEKSEKNLFEICAESKPEPLKSSCSNARTSRRGSCVSFHEPVAEDFPFCDPPFRNCTCLESDDPKPQKEVIKPAPETDLHTPVTISEQKDPKKKSKKRRYGGKCKRPIIVVSPGEEYQEDHKEEEKECKPKTSKSSICSGSSILNPASSPHSKPKSFIPYTRSSFHHVDSLNNLRKYTSGVPNHDPSLSVPRTAPQSTSCSQCAELSRQVGQLIKKVEALENTKIPSIRQEFDCLKAAIKCLTEKHEKKPEPRHEPSPCLEKKESLSTCQFCRGCNLPVLESFKRQLMETIGNRSYTNVVISIFLRADNIYHVNIRELKNCSSLACFLVSDDAIMEVQRMGLFKEILTFCVIDVRNTLKPKNCALGITFELVDSERQKGGCDSVDRGVCITCKPFLARVLGLPLHWLKHVHTDPEITANYLKKSFRNLSGKEQA